MAVLRERWEKVRSSRRPALLTLLGPPGIGKSRLLREFTAGVDAAAVYWGRCLSYGDGITYWAVDEMLRDAAGILHSDEDSTMSAKLASLVESLGGSDAAEARTLTVALGTLIGSSTAASGGASRARISRTELHWAIRPGLDLPAGAVERLLRNAGGNPLFLEETVGMLAATGAADLGRGKLLERVESLPVPSSLQSLIEARVDQLPPREKKVAQHAAVVGGVFWSGAVAHLNETREGLDDDLQTLERRDLIQAAPTSTIETEDEYAFKHILIRDVAYGELPKARRAALHSRIAGWISALPGAEDQYVEIVAYHLEQSCRLVREVGRTTVVAPVAAAAQALTRAGERAERREGFREAERFYTRALDVLGTSDTEERLELRLRRGLVLKALGELGQATTELVEIERRALVLERPDLRCEALIALANIDGKQGRPADARRRLEEGETIVRAIGNPRLLVQQVFEHSAFRAHFDSAADVAINELRSVLPTVEALGDRTLLMEGHMRLGTLLFNVGRLAGAEWELTQCSALASEAGSFRAKARADSLLGFVKYYRGEFEEAERLGIEAHDLLERTGDTYIQLQNYHKLAMYATARGDPHLAEERLRVALPLALQIGGWSVPQTYRRLAPALVRPNRVNEAVECAALAAASAPEGDGYARPAVLLAGASATTLRREPVAIERFNDAVPSLEDQQLAVDLGGGRRRLAWRLRACWSR